MSDFYTPNEVGRDRWPSPERKNPTAGASTHPSYLHASGNMTWVRTISLKCIRFDQYLLLSSLPSHPTPGVRGHFNGMEFSKFPFHWEDRMCPNTSHRCLKLYICGIGTFLTYRFNFLQLRQYLLLKCNATSFM